jgi:endonuclease/exonuclease/phosphatase family metal-dependent hydrolase
VARRALAKPVTQPSGSAVLRILTYNVHRCVGTDGRLDVGRIAAVIAAESPDIVALQEVDVGRARTGGVDQAHDLAKRLGMVSRFHAALQVEEEQYGDAVLTARPERLVKAGPLPGHPRIPRLEPRGALWVSVDVGDSREVQIINTHLGLVPYEQRLQAEALAGPDWLGSTRGPTVLLGDFNSTPRTRPHQILARRLISARHVRPGARIATFPAALPVLRIDHVFVSAEVRVSGLRVGASPAARIASDHRPLIMDFDI